MIERQHPQVPDLSQQPLLQQPDALRPLTALHHLTHLALRLTGSSMTLPCSSWQVVAGLTGLRVLNVSGCSMCYLYSSSSRQ